MLSGLLLQLLLNSMLLLIASILSISVNYFSHRFRKYLETYYYQLWVKQYGRFNEKQRANLKERLEKIDPVFLPTISVVVPVFNPPLRLIQETIASVTAQVYERWELCIADDHSSNSEVLDFLRSLIKKDPRIKIVFRDQQEGIASASNAAIALAQGDFIAFLDHDDLLTPDALAEVALTIASKPEVGFLYSDEDKIDGSGRRSDPFFKPDWNPDLLTSLNYCCHLSVMLRSLVIEQEGLTLGLEGAQDWDLILRVTEQLLSHQIIHIPKILYHWRLSSRSTAQSIKSKPTAIQASKKVLTDHLQRTQQPFLMLEQLHEGGHWRVKRALPECLPWVSIIIPRLNHRDLMKRCLATILTKTDYPHYEVIIAGNTPEEKEVTLKNNPPIRMLSLPGLLNPSVIINHAVTQAHGEVLVLLNSHIEIIDRYWLSELVSQAMRPQVGAVGVLLRYPNGSIQHAGIVLGMTGSIGASGVTGHVGKDFRKQRYVGGNRMCVTQNFSAVTGACLAVRKKLYEEVGGFDEKYLPDHLSDIDFCLKLRAAGYWNVWTPHTTCIHHQLDCHDSNNTPEEKKLLANEITTMRQRWGKLLEADPAYNPNLTLAREDWSLAWPPRQQ